MRSDTHPGPRTPGQTVRWRDVASWAAPIAVVATLVGCLHAIDPWLSFLPHGLGRRWTESFLRSLLIVYPGLIMLIPLLFGVTAWLVLRLRRRGRRSPRLARLCLACGSAGLSLVALELAASAWLSWEHRMPVLPTSFAQPPGSENDLSLVVIGGSSALGYPYNPKVSIGQMVAWKIGQALPARKVVLDIRANLGKNTEEMHLGLVNLKRRPDFMIIYSGHNEFLSRFEHSRDAGYAEMPEGSLLRAAYRLSLHSPLCLLIYETVRKHRLGGPPPPINDHQLIDAPALTPSEYVERITDFRRRLDALAVYCKRIGAVPIMIIDPANESGFEPNRTVLPGLASRSMRNDLISSFERARASERDSPGTSMGLYRALIERAPEFAEAHFRLGRLLEREGRFDEARHHYIRARDLDGYPVRCTTLMAGIYREVAARHGCILVDGPEVLRRLSRHGILDDELFHDAHHPSFAAQVALAQSVLDELFRRGERGLGADRQEAPRIDPAVCAAHFQVNTQTWTSVLLRAANYYGQMAAARFDPSERRSKQHRLLKAGRQIGSGRISPEQAGIPGIGLPPPTSFRIDWWAAEQAEEPGEAGPLAGNPAHSKSKRTPTPPGASGGSSGPGR